MAGRHILSILAVATVALSGCAAELGDAPFLCNKGGNPECPDGYECQGVCCVKIGAEPGSGCGGGQTCNNNGKCEAGENTGNCPKDCPKKTDGGVQPEGGNPKQDTGTPPPPDQFVPPPPDQFVPPPDQYKPPAGNFGTKCNTSAPCTAAFQCTTVGATATDGFCTKKCYTSGSQCTGMLGGTMAYCLLSNSAKTEYYCAFLCKLGTQSWPCPSGLKCDPAENPPGSGQFVCLP